MSRVIDMIVLGEPVAKGRPRFVRKTGRAYTPSNTINYENLIKITYQSTYDGDKKIFFEKDTPLYMEVIAYLPIPSSVSKKVRQQMIDMEKRPTKKPDTDNIIKIVGDALNGIAYHDDSQIVSSHMDKYYAEEPRLRIIIKEV